MTQAFLWRRGFGASAVVPPKASRNARFDFSRDTGRCRQRIMNFFARAREFRAIATRGRTESSFHASINPAAAIIASR
jgi:hypothetical protein